MSLSPFSRRDSDAPVRTLETRAAADLKRLAAKKERLLRRANGRPVEVRVGEQYFVVATRRDIDGLLSELQTA